MSTGTPLDLTPFGPLLSALGVAYWAMAACLVGLAIWLPRRRSAKILATMAVTAAFVTSVAVQVASQIQKRGESRARLDPSMALFAERCKSVGEKISRTAADVGALFGRNGEDLETR